MPVSGDAPLRIRNEHGLSEVGLEILRVPVSRNAVQFRIPEQRIRLAE